MSKQHGVLLSVFSVSAALLLSATPLWSQSLIRVHGTQSQSQSQTMESDQQGMSQNDVQSAQQALKDKGQDPGPVDGIMGPKTQAALKQFQQDQGPEATGTLDDQTKQALGLETGNNNSETNSNSEQQNSSSGQDNMSGSQAPQTQSGSEAGSDNTSAPGQVQSQ